MCYYFRCQCSDSCNYKSEELGKDYYRLVGRVWIIKEHLDENVHEVVKEFKNGYIVKIKGEF